MNTLPSIAKIEADVIGIIAQALMLKQNKITQDTRLLSDLGAESIDVLDIRFRLERHFMITIPDGAIVKSLGDNLTATELDAAFTPANITLFIVAMLNKPE